MSEEPGAPDLVELTRRPYEGGNRRDFDAVLSYYGRDAVWDMSPFGLGRYEGLAAIRRFFVDWVGAYDEFQQDPEEILDLGNGVVFVVLSQNARPVGSTGHVQLRYAAVIVWAQGVITRITNYRDIEEARAAAERLAEERAR